jgi:NAD(P)-dependent dehydrogenase (short-subunit alcohol dehydrogenase family)
VSAFGKPADTLLHLVGGFAMGPLDSKDAVETWDRMITLNLTSAFQCYRAMLPGLRAQGGGWIVGLGSRAARDAGANLAAYAASKAGLAALTQSLSAEVRGIDIHVNLILASTIDTPANRRAMGEEHAGDWVTPDDIAEATLYLCSERARAVHGATLELYAKA